MVIQYEQNEITAAIVDSAIKVHQTLGPGLLESAYEACLAFELQRRGLNVTRQTVLPLIYEGVRVDAAYRIDMLVAESVVVELKTCTEILPIHKAQLLSYLKLSGHHVGLILNFHVTRMKNGIVRMVFQTTECTENTELFEMQSQPPSVLSAFSVVQLFFQGVAVWLAKSSGTARMISKNTSS